MEEIEKMLESRKWAKDCLRINISQPENIIQRGKNQNLNPAIASLAEEGGRPPRSGASLRPRVVGRRYAGFGQ